MIRLKVKEVAEKRRIGIARLARRADMDYKTVQRIFQDPYRDINLSTLAALAKALKVPSTSLIEDEPDAPEEDFDVL